MPHDPRVHHGHCRRTDGYRPPARREARRHSRDGPLPTNQCITSIAQKVGLRSQSPTKSATHSFRTASKALASEAFANQVPAKPMSSNGCAILDASELLMPIGDFQKTAAGDCSLSNVHNLCAIFGSSFNTMTTSIKRPEWHLSKLVHLGATQKPISDARTATYVILSLSSGPGGRWFKSTRPDHSFWNQRITSHENPRERLVRNQALLFSYSLDASGLRSLSSLPCNSRFALPGIQLGTKICPLGRKTKILYLPARIRKMGSGRLFVTGVGRGEPHTDGKCRLPAARLPLVAE